MISRKFEKKIESAAADGDGQGSKAESQRARGQRRDF